MTDKAPRRPVLDILLSDSHVVVLDKPPGIPAGRGSDRESAAERARAALVGADDEDLQPVYSLEPDASGVLVLARTRAVLDELREQLRTGRLEVVFHALVCGYVEREGTVELPLRYSRRTQRIESGGGVGRPLSVRYRVLERVSGHTWLECIPEAANVAQLRAHLAAFGHPLSVDSEYGGGESILLSHYKPGYRPSRRREERPLIERLSLHAAQVSFLHPTAGPLTIAAPLPKELRATLNQLGRLV